ncbi:hypothetical protein PGTUg99_017356 [Puccinia graminis f. sp. tritici]|uniref:Uncharacterized protein n=1 Tax=Puccinia graminis f. sp. tritici TaxID=56615 RepID=A0A5B0Q8Z7_PUCGR|nr:hypothetical protein PGTUg99_017356 [Puccinia graminis f. sp. tritici]
MQLLKDRLIALAKAAKSTITGHLGDKHLNLITKHENKSGLTNCASIYGLVGPANPSRDSLSFSPAIGINAPRSTKAIADIVHGGSSIRVKHTIAR